jgi:sirohydrochlorin ferrochelatase
VTPGIVVFAHGSRVESANDAVRAAAAGLARAGGFDHVEAAFLELGQPDLAGAVERLYRQGLRRIAVVPYFLTLGLHMERDLPGLAERISNQYNDLAVFVTPPLDGHPALIQVLLDRARAALLVEPPPLNK